LAVSSPDKVTSLSFSPDGRTLASTSVDEDRIRVWDLANGKERFPDRSPSVPLGSFLFTPDGKTLIAGGRDGSLHVFDARTGVLQRTIDAHRSRVGDIALLADGRTLLSVGASGTAKLWDAATGRELRRLSFTRDFGFDTLILSDDGRTLLTGAPPHRLVDLATGRERGALPAHPEDATAPFAAVFAPGGRTVWAAYGDYVLECDSETGRPVRRVEPPEEVGRPCRVKAIALSPDGHRVAMGQRQVHLLETSTGREVARLTAPDLVLEDAPGLVFTADGKLLVATTSSGDWAHNLRVWEVASGRLLGVLAGPTRETSWPDAWARQIISPDGRRMVTRGREGAATIWDIASLLEAGRAQVPRSSGPGAP
jgi:WD40 repeat protein